MNYIAPDGEKHRPVMLHRVILGSIERFIGVLIEHYAGAFPLWLAPVQVVVLPITDRHHGYAAKVGDALRRLDVRVEIDDRNEKLGYKIREARLQRVPYMVVVGDQEADNGTVSIRRRDGEESQGVPMQEFIDEVVASASIPRIG